MRSQGPKRRPDWTHTAAKARPVDIRGLTPRGAEIARALAAARDPETECGEDLDACTLSDDPTCPVCAGHLAAGFWVEALGGEQA